jgi:lipopolysaccharide biosynthesis regulator YciM
MILALGGKKSGQLDKAIERFLLIVNKDPENLEAIFHLAECYEMHNDKPNAVKWYTLAAKKVKVPEAKEAIAKRIAELKK